MMLILDTNVISELMRPMPAQSVAGWFEKQALEDLAITAITVGEILHGLDLVPVGRRRSDLSDRFAKMLERAFSGHVLAFDGAAAVVYARIRGDRQRAGRPVGISDAMIAAIARTRAATVVTRNVVDFEGCGIAIVDPWTGRRG